jgi:capsular exopolysaccharide synthesis family protein
VELRHYLRIVRKGWPLILAITVLCTAIGLGVTLASKKIYQANATIFVSLTTVTTTGSIGSTDTFIQGRVLTYVDFATSPGVLQPVISSLKLSTSEVDLAKQVSASVPASTGLIDIHVQNGNPTQAATIANAVAVSFSKYVVATEQTDSDGKPIVKLTVTHPATVPSTPVKPNKVLNIGLGLIVGLLVGLVVVITRDVLDNTVKGPQDFEELGVPLLGHIPFDKRFGKSPIAFRGDSHSARSEAFRQLRTNLQYIDVDNPPRVIAVTSALPGEGKSSTSINLAAALAEAGNRVCLVETDLRRPSLARVLGLVGDVGFTTVLIGKTPVESVLQNAGRNLAVLTSGPLPPNPSELLLSEQAKALIRNIAEQVDYVILDTPPLLPVTDGAEMATVADATVLVHKAGRTTRDQVQRAVQALAKVDRHPVGAILNMITRGGGTDGYEYGYYYVDYSVQRQRKDADKDSGRRGRKNDKEDLVPLMSDTASEDAASAEALPSIPANESVEGSVPATALDRPTAKGLADDATSTLPRITDSPTTPVAAPVGAPVSIDDDLVSDAPSTAPRPSVTDPYAPSTLPNGLREPARSSGLQGTHAPQVNGTGEGADTDSTTEDAFRR